MQTYKITFTTKGRYPQTRTVEVTTKDQFNAVRLVHQEFGSFRIQEDKILHITAWLPTDKIRIDEITLV
jgi:hypothetical protein